MAEMPNVTPVTPRNAQFPRPPAAGAPEPKGGPSPPPAFLPLCPYRGLRGLRWNKAQRRMDLADTPPGVTLAVTGGVTAVPLGVGAWCESHHFAPCAWRKKTIHRLTARPGQSCCGSGHPESPPPRQHPRAPRFWAVTDPLRATPFSVAFGVVCYRRLGVVHAMFRHWMQPMVVFSQPQKWRTT